MKSKKRGDSSDTNRRIALGIAVIIIISIIIYLQNPFAGSSQITGELRNSENTGLDIGNNAPDFILKTVDGESIQLSNSIGKATVINFWASWCPPCREEFPAFESIFQDNKDRLSIIGVNLQESSDAVSSFSDEFGISFDLVLDPGSDVKKMYNVFTQPVTYFLDTNGVIVDKKFGPLTEGEITEKFGKLGID